MKRTGVRTQKVRFEMRPQDFMECASNDWYGLVEVDWLREFQSQGSLLK